MEYDFKEFPLTIHMDGDHIGTDLENYKTMYKDQGYEYFDMVTLPTRDINTAEVLLKFRRPK